MLVPVGPVATTLCEGYLLIVQALESRAIQALKRYGASPWFSLVCGGLAFAAALSVLIPFGGILSACVLMAPKRWRSIVLFSSLGAALGVFVVALTFKHLGVVPLVQAYPDLMQSSSWVDAKGWLDRYGIFSLVAVAGLPVPLTPALLLACLADLPLVHIAAAVWLGRWIKFAVYAYGVLGLVRQWKSAPKNTP